MNRIPRLLCLTALVSSTALAQTTAAASLPSDPMLASERLPADYAQASTAKPSAAHLHSSESQNSGESQNSSGSLRGGTQSSGAPSSRVPATIEFSGESSGAQLQTAALGPAQPQLQPRANVSETVLPVATVLRIRLALPISTSTFRPGQKFFATLTNPVVVDGRTIIPSGTSVTCRVDGAHSGRRFSGKPSLTIRAISVQLPSGEVLRFTASVMSIRRGACAAQRSILWTKLKPARSPGLA